MSAANPVHAFQAIEQHQSETRRRGRALRTATLQRGVRGRKASGGYFDLTTVKIKPREQ